jgi:hypothetical protein
MSHSTPLSGRRRKVSRGTVAWSLLLTRSLQKARLAPPQSTLPYRYEQLLHVDSIRILILHASPGEDNDVVCTIQLARLDDPDLEYEAVSYTWGDTTNPRKVRLRSSTRTLSVTRNCYNALRRLRHQRHDRILWVDAICINQENLQERARQVRMMDRIFKNAYKVAIYLGEHDEGSLILFEELGAAQQALVETSTCHRPHPGSRIVFEVERLYERSWFSRVWVLQEVAEAEDWDVTLTCGSSTVYLAALCALHFDYDRRTALTYVGWPLPFGRLYDNQWEMFQSQTTAQSNLWALLCGSRHCLATDPRDKVFALRSLVDRMRSQMDDLIDYSRSTEDTYVEVAKFLLPVLGLWILTAARHPHDRAMPSWIPDWTQRLPIEYQFFDYDSQVNIIKDHESRVRPVRVGGCALPFTIAEESYTHLELTVDGCQYATITARSRPFSFGHTRDIQEQLSTYFPLFHVPVHPEHPPLDGCECYSAGVTSDMLGPEISEGGCSSGVRRITG